MKFFDYRKEKNHDIVKFLGLTLFEQIVVPKEGTRRQYFVCKLVSTYTVNNLINNVDKYINIFGIPVIHRIEDSDYRYYYLWKILFRKTDLLNSFKKMFLKYVDKKHDDIYILNGNSGEICLFLTYMTDAVFRKNNSKNPLLITSRKYHYDMARLICPDIPCVYIRELSWKSSKIKKDIFKFNKFRFFMIFSTEYFWETEKAIKTQPEETVNFFECILKKLDISKDELEMRSFQISSDIEKSMLEKIRKTGLNLNKFVFLAPEAKSCELIDDSFWCELINKFQANGYDAFVNLTDKDFTIDGAEYKTCFLTYPETYALARLAKRLISLRSGLVEFLMGTNVPMDILYTKFRYRHLFDDLDVCHVMSGFGLMQIPFIDKSKIQEFNMFEISPGECLKHILKQVGGCLNG